jgi:hypothetical protein
MDIHLQNFMESPCGWGRLQGRKTCDLLKAHLQAHPEPVIRISLAGIEQMDVSFARVAVIALARSERRWRGYCLTDASNPDLLDNWSAAAIIGEQPILTWNDELTYHILGPQPTVGLRSVLALALAVPVIRVQDAAVALNLKVPNASNKLKQLWHEGYLLRKEQSAISGGLEYEYFRIG